jgi:PAS domain S-box-containing protein
VIERERDPRRTGSDTVPDAAPVPVLIVDDNAGKRLALRSVLAPSGYRIVEADSGMAALRCLMHEDFAVILLDVRMPVMDGFETAQMIRQREQSELTPIIFITAFTDDAMDDLAGYATGAADFISSPVPTAVLKAKVSVFTNLFQRARLLAEQARTLQEATDELALLADTAPVGIFRLAVENTYVYVNARWTEITGITSDEAIGQPWHIVLGDGGPAEHAATPFGAVGTDDAFTSARFTLGGHAATGATGATVVQATAKPLLGRDNAVAGWVGTVSDVTDEEAAKTVMRDARDAALATTLMQSNFTVSASHELRTPTTSVLGFIEEVLENDEVSHDDRRCLDIAYRSAQRLSALIDDLLVLGEEDIGAGRMCVEPTLVNGLVETVVSSFSATAQQAEVTLVVDTGAAPGADTGADPGADPPCASVDPVRLEQALNNLLSNALKFTPPGGDVTVVTSTDEESVRIVVTDTGMGIDPQAMDSIFSRFYRAMEAAERGIRGTGLGLAIALQMIEAQGGQLTVASVVGEGSSFTITLPRADRRSTV